MGYDNEFAVAALTARPYLVFDIETMPMPGCAEYLTDPIEAPSNYKDPIKIAAYIADAKARQVEQAGLDCDLCEIAAIGWHRADGVASYDTRGTVPEGRLLHDFWDVAGNDLIVGFNCLAFDLQILLRRSLYLGIATPKLSIDKYRHDGIVDLADMLTYGGRTKWRSLAFYAKRFGIPHDDSVKGEDIAGLCAAGDWGKVAAHVKADVVTTEALARRLGIIQAADTREPADPDGEAFRGGEAAAYDREQQCIAQGLK